MALESYLDGSVGEKPRLLTLAGFATEDSIWIEFDNGWNDILQSGKGRPRAQYIHMREANPRVGEFDRRKGWTDNKIGALIVELLMYVQHFDKKRFLMSVCTVVMDDYEKLKSSGFLLPEPEEICNIHCPQTIFSWYAANYPGVISAVHFFFDQNESFKEYFESKWKKKKEEKYYLGVPDMWWSLIKTVTTADMRDKPGLQAADLFAWATNRRQSGEHKKYGSLAHIMKQVIPNFSIICDEKKLRELYDPKMGPW